MIIGFFFMFGIIDVSTVQEGAIDSSFGNSVVVP
jgi:hypothetical protein